MSVESLLPMVVNTGTQMYKGVQDGNDSARVAMANAKAQARASLANASQVRNEATRREEQLRRQGRAFLGKKTASMAQAGVLDTGTSVGVLDQNRMDAELEALDARRQGLSRSDALMTDAQNAIIQGKNMAAEAKSRGLHSAIGILAQSAANAYKLVDKGTAGAKGSGAPGSYIDLWKYGQSPFLSLRDAWNLSFGPR